MARVIKLALVIGGALSQAPAACHPDDLPMGGGRAGSAQIRAPVDTSPAGIAAWLSKMRSMRTACNNATGLAPPGSPSIFDEPALKWTQTSYIGPQMHPYDRFFYDPALGNGTGGAGYTVDKWLADLNARYGGIDQALIWPTYTNIGIDDRNTWDLIRSMPGGTEGIRAVVAQLHARGVRVLWPYHPWDHSTHGQQRNNATDFEAMAQLLRDTGADGFNADTMGHVPKAFLDASTKIYKPIAIQAEAGLPELDLPYTTIGWAEGWKANETGKPNDPPDVDKPKWLSSGRAVTNWCARWSGSPGNGDKNKISILQVAWFNGLGIETWENVWGTWNGIIERDGEAIRRVGAMLRFFGARGFLQSPAWVPHTDEVLQMGGGVFGSAFPLSTTGETVWTLVNRNDSARSGAQLRPRQQVAGSGSSSSEVELRYFDCYRGTELTPDPASKELSFTLEAGGFGCVLATPNATSIGAAPDAAKLRLTGGARAVPATLGAFLAAMASLTAKPLSAFDGNWYYLNQTMVDAGAKTAVRPLHDAQPDEVYVEGNSFHFQAGGQEIEGSSEEGAGEQFPWEAHSQKTHDHVVQVGAMYVDKFPVTNAKYAAYLATTGYVPADRANWLKRNFNFGSDGTPQAPKAGWEDRPVTYVSLDDARAYCKHNSKRLPHTHEWQYFAQGNDGRTYPWGNSDNASLTPPVNNDYDDLGPAPVGQYPAGASPFGVEDLVRNVWQMTTEFQDAHTRSLSLRGGALFSPWRGQECRWIENDDGTPRNIAPACFAAASTTPVPGSTPHPMGGSHWYFPTAFQLNQFGKYFLMGGSYDRAGTIGFRCVADALDDCGNDNKLCAAPKCRSWYDCTPPAAVTLPTGVDADWVAAAGGLPITRKAPGGQPSMTFEPSSDLSSIADVPNGTSFSWTGGSSPSPSGSNDRGGVLFGGSDGGFVVRAPAPSGAAATVTVYLAHHGSAVGNLTAHCNGNAVVAKTTGNTVVAVRYEGGPVVLSIGNARGSVCDAMKSRGGVCLRPTTPIAPKAVVSSFSTASVIDWVHFGVPKGSAKPAQPWFENRMAGGLGVLVPSLSGAEPSALKSYNNAAATYSWTNGTPVASTAGLVAGIYAKTGVYQFSLPAPPTNTTWVLTVYAGVFATAAQFEVTSADGQFANTERFAKAAGTRNFGLSVAFSGAIKVSWSRDVAGDKDEDGNITLQAAKLEVLEGSSDGIVLQSVTLTQK